MLYQEQEIHANEQIPLVHDIFRNLGIEYVSTLDQECNITQEIESNICDPQDAHSRVQGRSENSHYFGLFNIILSQISPEIISIIRDASQLSGIMTKPSRIRFFFEK